MKIIKKLLVLILIVGVAVTVFYNTDLSGFGDTLSQKLSYISLDNSVKEEIDSDEIYFFDNSQTSPTALPYNEQTLANNTDIGGHWYDKMNSRQRLYYHLILSAFEDMTDTFFEVSKDDGDYKNNISIAYNGVLSDNPEIFWQSGSYEIKVSDSGVCSLKLGFCMDITERNQKRQALETELDTILADTVKLTDFEKEICFYELLCDRTDYSDLESDTKYTAFGAICSGSAVCEGYAKAMQLLCKRSGIECLLVRGVTGGIHHMWNMIKLSDKWYELDLTLSDRPGSTPNYFYFNATTEEFSATYNRLKDISDMSDTADYSHLTYNFHLPEADGTLYNRDAAYNLYDYIS